MLLLRLLLVASLAALINAEDLGDSVIYPQPTHFEMGILKEAIYFTGFSLQFVREEDKLLSEICDKQALAPYIEQLQIYASTRLQLLRSVSVPETSCAAPDGRTRPPTADSLSELHITAVLGKVDAPSDFVEVAVDAEEYEILIDGSGKAVTLRCRGYLSYIRSLESLFQLLRKEGRQFSLRHYPLSVRDKPSYAYRGLMLDTARHYLAVEKIKQVIDGMQAVKLNVLHLHLTDSESFPLQLSAYRAITEAGAYSSQEVYSAQSIQELVWYGQNKGVLIVPEVDAPAHARSWAQAPGFEQLNACGNYTRSQWQK